jgi:hypothetical protein
MDRKYEISMILAALLFSPEPAMSSKLVVLYKG